MKQLRISFAMGGGVSLGTFSGSSLTEAIKLILLDQIRRLRRGDDPEYNSITIDSFSGASAGTLSLALMLRALCCPTETELADARGRLALAHSDLLELSKGTLSALPNPRVALPADQQQLLDGFVQDLAAADVAQQLQKEAWVDAIDIVNLLPDRGPRSAALRTAPSILDQDAVSAIVREVLLAPVTQNSEQKADFSRRRLLANRTLFAASIANVTPMEADARREFTGKDPDAVLIGLAEGGRSDTHREMRVFDLHFEPQKFFTQDLDRIDNFEFPFRWFLTHAGDPSPDGQSWFDLREPKTWERIALTAMASGAFPFAFPPVVLERFDYEFGFKTGDDASARRSTWPELLRQAKKSSFGFSYVDGGTFNNEPIREAFRMGSYLDGNDKLEADIERLVIFVDPAVKTDQRPLQCGIHRLVLSGNDDGGAKELPYIASSLDRLLPHAIQLVSAVINEGRVVEADKIFQVRDQRDFRDSIGRLIDALQIAPTGAEGLARGLAEDLEKRFRNEFFSELIPALPLKLNVELERQIRVLRTTTKDPVYTGMIGKVDDFRANFPQDPAVAQRWIKVLLHTLLDFAMNLGGKDKHARVIAIAPFGNLGGPRPPQPARPRPIPLLGAPLFAFYGFFDQNLRSHDFAVGRHCAGLFLQKAGMIPGDAPIAARPNSELFKPGNVERGIRLLTDRVVALAGQTHLPVLKGLDFPIVSAFLKGKLRAALRKISDAGPVVRPLEIRVRTTDRKLEFDGRLLGDREPMQIGDAFQLVTTIDCIFGTEADGESVVASVVGYDLPDGHLDIDRDGIVDRDFARLVLPASIALTEAIAKGALGIACNAPTEASKNPVEREWLPFFAGNTTALLPDPAGSSGSTPPGSSGPPPGPPTSPTPGSPASPTSTPPELVKKLLETVTKVAPGTAGPSARRRVSRRRK